MSIKREQRIEIEQCSENLDREERQLRKSSGRSKMENLCLHIYNTKKTKLLISFNLSKINFFGWWWRGKMCLLCQSVSIFEILVTHGHIMDTELNDLVIVITLFYLSIDPP